MAGDEDIEGNEQSLDALLAELENEKPPPLKESLGKMDSDHFSQVVQAVNEEYMKRVDSTVKVGDMTDNEFREYCRLHGC
jgi:hypothetical protein